MKPCPLPLVALRGDETCPRCGRPAREHRGHPNYQETTMEETTEPTREWIEKCIRELDSALVGSKPAAFVSQMGKDLAVYRMALRTLDAEAQLAELKEGFAASEKARDRVFAQVQQLRTHHGSVAEVASLRADLNAMTERAELAETLLGAANAAVDALRMTVDILETDARAIRDAAMTHAGEFMHAGETAAPAIERMATALREANERADRLQRHFDEAAPEHNLPALLDLYAERERAATERAEKAERELTGAVLQADVECAVKHELRAKLADAERRLAEVEPERDVSRSALNSIVSELRDALGDFPMVGEKWTDAVKRLRKQLADAERELDEARGDLESMTGLYNTAWPALDSARDERNALRAKLADAERLLAEVERERDAASFDAEAQKIRARTAEERLAEVERERDEEGRLRTEWGALYTDMVRQRDDWHEAAHAADERAAVSNGLREAAEAERDALRAKLADAELRVASATQDAPAPTKDERLYVLAENPTTHTRCEATFQRKRADWWRSEAKRLGWTPDYPELREEQTSDARIDCESSSLLLLSTWARKVMMRPKNRAKGVPSESVWMLLGMAREELFEASDAIYSKAPTDDILAELGDAAADIAFAMREIEKRRKA